MDRPLQPLLIRFAIPRVGSDELPGFYDPVAKLWMSKDKAGSFAPIVTAAALPELVTKTKVAREQDDPGTPAEQATKTENIRERDDADLIGVLVELATKTLQRVERDD